MDDEFTQFEHEGWERVADKYDSVWSKSTRQFIPYLLDAAEVLSGMSLLDVGCGPGYVSAAAVQRGAFPSGLDFSREMVAIARRTFPGIEFREGDAQNLFYDDASFDRVLANFALLHLSDPERACAEAFRVLKPGGKFGFTVWAPPPVNPYAKIVDDALEAHADLNVKLPPGPPHYLYSGKEEFRKAMERTGFDGASMVCYSKGRIRDCGIEAIARQEMEVRTLEMAPKQTLNAQRPTPNAKVGIPAPATD